MLQIFSTKNTEILYKQLYTSTHRNGYRDFMKFFSMFMKPFPEKCFEPTRRQIDDITFFIYLRIQISSEMMWWRCLLDSLEAPIFIDKRKKYCHLGDSNRGSSVWESIALALTPHGIPEWLWFQRLLYVLYYNFIDEVKFLQSFDQ